MIPKKIITVNPSNGLKSIQQCFMELGARHEDVYVPERPFYKKKPNRYANIYKNYNAAELLDWAKHLYRESVKKYHPDKTEDSDRIYRINTAYNRIKTMVENRANGRY